MLIYIIKKKYTRNTSLFPLQETQLGIYPIQRPKANTITQNTSLKNSNTPPHARPHALFITTHTNILSYFLCLNHPLYHSQRKYILHPHPTPPHPFNIQPHPHLHLHPQPAQPSISTSIPSIYFLSALRHAPTAEFYDVFIMEVRGYDFDNVNA